MSIDTTGMHLLAVAGQVQVITPCFTNARRTFDRLLREYFDATVTWHKDCPLAGRLVELGNRPIGTPNAGTRL